MENKYLKALKAAFPHTIPIFAGFWFIALTYGIYMNAEGFNFLYPCFMSMAIFAGSMEFVTVTLLLGNFDPIGALMLTLMVNARHLFYGISMLDKFRGTGLKKLYLIFGMCDETFSVNCTADLPPDVDKGWFMFFVTLLNQIYWVVSSTAGSLLGYVIHFNTKGIEFVMTALFVVMFLGQWEKKENRVPALVGLIGTAVCLPIFGSKYFIVPAMVLIVAAFAVGKKIEDREGKKI